MVLYFAGFQRHYSIYPATPHVVAALRKELAGRVHSKATIRFSYADPVPTRLITRVAKVRAAEVAERTAAKSASYKPQAASYKRQGTQRKRLRA